ncbi:MAG TPA: four helix bundle protein, partial [Candidatus Aminicenantes bacterium]|nr:four helix bundle protein [Candidatus Aminicenantes bacterium]
AISIPSNIAEGAARTSDKEFKQFLSIALGSAAEVETQLILTEKLGLFASTSELQGQLSDIRKMLTGLSHYISRNDPSRKG